MPAVVLFLMDLQHTVDGLFQRSQGSCMREPAFSFPDCDRVINILIFHNSKTWKVLAQSESACRQQIQRSKHPRCSMITSTHGAFLHPGEDNESTRYRRWAVINNWMEVGGKDGAEPLVEPQKQGPKSALLPRWNAQVRKKRERHERAEEDKCKFLHF